jgi:hypothetical protein
MVFPKSMDDGYLTIEDMNISAKLIKENQELEVEKSAWIDVK